MIITVVLAKVKMIHLSPDLAINIAELSNDNALDFATCEQNMYQVTMDGSLEVKGIKKGLQSKRNLGFVDVGIQSVSRVFCVDGELWYLTQSGQLMAEDVIESGKLKFKQVMTQHVLDLSSTSDTIFVATTEGFFVKGSCQDFRCGVDTTEFAEFSKITFSQFTSNVISFRIHDSLKNVFLYLENGDVYLTGQTDNFPIVQDSDPIRKIGSGIKAVQIGYNASNVQQVLYYLRGTDMVMYSNKLTPKEQVVMTGVLDYLYFQQHIMLKKDKIEIFQERSFKKNSVELYCGRFPTDPLCVKFQQNGQLNQQDCPDDSILDVCKIKKCEYGPPVAECQYSQQCDKNVTCWALKCKEDDSITKYLPECHIDYINITLSTPHYNAQDSFFRDMFYFDLEKQQSVNKVSPGGAAGIAIAACVVVFVLIITIVIVQLKRKQPNSKIVSESTEVILPELTTAQSVEVQ
ncbi:Regulator_of chromosome condensation 1/beta-lactamase-inhibitor protein II [Hexamita inflata]|uniref:Regulator_of chromosome condensation 1/beta-lactamase-inhibitor protein II n=1 Tax=Hexamita inflata TaxID=28002 RepID=A0ABP1LUR1_9EUKA